jgi:Holliday junction resolvase RusA-like endonuclease
MAKREKIDEKLLDKKYIEKIISEYITNKEIINVKFVYPGQPENYVRERYTNRGKRFYNKKAKQMDEANKFYASQLDVLTRDKLNKLIANKDAEYYVKIDADFYLKTPDGDSIKTVVLKEEKIILPGIRPDLDNYDKFLIDVLHSVLFDDDKRVVSLNTNKYYSINPRTEIKSEIVVLNNYL